MTWKFLLVSAAVAVLGASTPAQTPVRIVLLHGPARTGTRPAAQTIECSGTVTDADGTPLADELPPGGIFADYYGEPVGPCYDRVVQDLTRRGYVGLVSGKIVFTERLWRLLAGLDIGTSSIL